jgi:hypothetical protein
MPSPYEDDPIIPDEALQDEAETLETAPIISSPEDLRRTIFLVAVGLFISTMGQTGVIGNLPFRFLFKNQFHWDAAQQANFFAVATMAWYFKPLAGLLCDSVPIFGTRRRYYLILSSAMAGVCWLLFMVAPKTYFAYFWLMIILNTMMVITSTVVGGLLVEAGQEGGATGRMASVRYAIDNIISVIVGPLGGWLAMKAFGLTAGIGAFLLFAMVPATILLLREPPVARLDLDVWKRARAQFRIILHSGTMWAAAVLLFFVFVAPGFGIALNYYQSDVLKFDTKFIGDLQALGGIGGIAGTALYAVYCRKLTLKPLLWMGILLNALSSLLYLGYHSHNLAILIDTSNGFLGVLGVLPLFDLAARATPKGCESFGYALLMSVYNLAVFAVSNPVGSWLYELKNPLWHHNLASLVWLNTGTSLVALVLVPFLPRVLVNKREGEPM